MKKTYYFTAAVMGLLITTAVVSMGAFAAGNLSGESAKPNFVFRHQEMMQVFTDGDYDAWAESTQEHVDALRAHANELEASINQETFNKLARAHQLMQSGDTEGAKAIFEELGMGGPGLGHGHGYFMKRLHSGETLDN